MLVINRNYTEMHGQRNIKGLLLFGGMLTGRVQTKMLEE